MLDAERQDIFLSYSHDDKKIVEKIASLLSKWGFKCWIDSKNLRHDDKFNPIVHDAISGCIVFIAFLSKTYVNKEYCPWEFSLAREKGKSILAVTLDDVTENTNKNASYMFSFKSGSNNLGYGREIKTDDDAFFVADFLKESYQLKSLKHYYESGSKEDLPKIKIPDIVFSQLKVHNEKQYTQSGNYALNTIKGELFPKIKDIEFDIFYQASDENRPSLTKYVDDMLNKRERKNLFLYGEGGIGKTVAMLKTTEHLISKGINAIYIPLSKIDNNNTIEKYLRLIVCEGVEYSWAVLRDAMSLKNEHSPSVVLLLDGVNELPNNPEVAKSIVSSIRNDFIDGYQGVDLIISSRWFDTVVLRPIKDSVTKLEMQQLDKTCINKYLQSVELLPIKDSKMLSVLSTPLLLTLYADVEKHREKYEGIEGIELVNNPNTPSKILSNFFQTQLFRASEEENFNRASYHILLEYMLPEIGFRMIRKKCQNMTLSYDEIMDIEENIEGKCKQFRWYIRDRLKVLVKVIGNIEIGSLLALAENSLHFLCKNNEKNNKGNEVTYKFLHQSFRDYFAAYHIANEMRAFCKNNERFIEGASVLEECCYDDYILSFVSDQLHEEEAAPRKNGILWEFPGKIDDSPSENSTSEKLLYLWRDKDGEKSQNAVYNLFNIMRIGRKGQLYYCDFSNLDMRKCFLGKNSFVEWDKNNIYPSKFDYAWIDLDSFVIDGHDVPITALCCDGHNTIFSGDESGVVKVFNTEDKKCKKTIDLYNEPVVDIAWESKTERLAIMYKYFLYIYSFKDETYKKIKNESRNGDFRYVGFDEKGELTVSYSLEPLTIRYLSGEVIPAIPSFFNFDVPARCAKWNPKRVEFVRSRLLQSIMVTVKGENNSWWLHPAFKENVAIESEITPKDHILAKEYFDISKNNDSVYCAAIYDPSHKIRSSFTIKVGRTLYVYNNKTKQVTHKKVFLYDIEHIHREYDTTSVNLENITVILKPDLSLCSAFFRFKSLGATESEGVRTITYSDDGNKMLIGIQNQLIEFETEGLTILRQKSFIGTIRAACYCKDKVIVAKDRDIYVLDRNLSENIVFQGSNTEKIQNYIEDYDGNGCYIITDFGTIKKLDHDLRVQKMRKFNKTGKCIWARDKTNGDFVLFISPNSKNPYGLVYDFKTSEVSDPLWNYELLDTDLNNDEKHYYILGTELLSYEKTPPFKKISFKNYSGVVVYGCSFKNVRGDISGSKGQTFIRKNGGQTDE